MAQNETLPYVASDAEFASLGDLLTAAWRGRRIILIATVCATLVAGVLSLVLEKRYSAAIVIAAVTDDPSASRLAGLGSIVSQFGGGLASLAGLASGGNDRKSESLAVLQSQALTEKFVADNGLLPVLFSEKWDSARSTWNTTDPKKVPTLWKANEFFRKRVRSVSTDTKTGLTTLTISWKDPQLAAKWANDIVALANDNLRGRAIRDSERNVAYLTEQLNKSNVVTVNNSVGALLEVEIKKIMLARGNSEYAFRIIDPAQAPERASFPSPVLWTILGFVLGFVGATALVMVVTIYRSDAGRGRGSASRGASS